MTFYIYTFGCKVNTYESNGMRDLLLQAGFCEVEKKGVADIYIINTCTVTNQADQKSYKTIRQVARNHPTAMILVVGCMSQLQASKVAQIPNISVILGNVNKSKILDYIKLYKQQKKQIIDIKDILKEPFERMQLHQFKHTRAFVKIQDGCNNYCSFCIIPYVRGEVRSRDKTDIIKEITDLVLQGHKEIVLTGIHTGHYGSEYSDYQFSDLIEEILTIAGLERIRISSIEMNEITPSLLRLFQLSNVLVDHLHIPLQSGSDTVLKAMNRHYTKEQFKEKIKMIRAIRPNISITTDVIVGFPGETEKLLEETIDTILEIGFSKLHVFPFSKREGTKAADMPNQVPEEIKKQRVRQLIQRSKELEVTYMNQFIGSVVEMIPEQIKDGMLIGHTGNYLFVKVAGSRKLLYQSIEVKITGICYPYCTAIIMCQTIVN